MDAPLAPKPRDVVAADGVRLGFFDMPPADGPANGEVVVLCHGLCAGAAQFFADGAAFAAAGYRVLIPDVRGHGASGSPGPAGDHSIARMADDMLRLLDAAGVEKVHWVGNSLGGIIGLQLLATAPARIRSFATFGTAYRLALPAPTPVLFPLLYALFGPKRLGWLTARATTPQRAAQPMIAALIAGFSPAVGQAIAAHVRAYDFRAAARAYAGPILLLRGGQDRAVNLALGDTFSAMAGHPDFRRVDLPAGGHCANLDVPEAWRAALLAFWGEIARRPI